MVKRILRVAVLALLLSLVIVSCTDENSELENKEELLDIKRDVVINIEDCLKRTIQPTNENLVRANYFVAKLYSSSDSNHEAVVKEEESKDNSIVLKEVPLGSYELEIAGYYQEGSLNTLVSEGAASFIIDLEAAKFDEETASYSFSEPEVVEVVLSLISSGEDLSGIVTAEFSWESYLSNEDNKNSYLAKVFSTYPLTVKLVDNENTKAVLASQSYTVEELKDKTSLTFSQPLSVTSGLNAHFEVWFKKSQNGVEYDYLFNSFAAEAVKIYSGQTSVPSDGIYSYNGTAVDNSSIPGAILSLDYGTIKDKEIDVKITGNAESSLDRIELYLYHIVNGERVLVDETHHEVDVAKGNAFTYHFSSADSPSYSDSVSKLEADVITEGNDYVVVVEGRRADGREFQNVEESIKTYIYVTAIEIEGFETSRVVGASFPVYAILNGGNTTPSITSVNWTISDSSVATITASGNGSVATITPIKPGKVTVTATSVGVNSNNEAVSVTTDDQLTVSFAKPNEPAVEIDPENTGVPQAVITWTSVAAADSYYLYKYDNGVKSETFELQEATYTDKDFLSGHEYTYSIVARLDNADEYDSEESEQSTPIKPVYPTITVAQPTITGTTIEFNEAKFEISKIQSQQVEVAPIDGVSYYKWVVDNKVPEGFEDAAKVNSYVFNLTINTEGLDDIGSEAHTLSLFIYDENKNVIASGAIEFFVVDVLAEEVEIIANSASNTVYTPVGSSYVISTRSYGLDKNNNRALSTKQMPTFISSDDSIAALTVTDGSESKATVTILAPGEYTISVIPANADEDDTTVIKSISATAYNTLTAQKVAETVVDQLGAMITAAGDKFNDDWVYATSTSKGSYETNDVTITPYYNGVGASSATGKQSTIVLSSGCVFTITDSGYGTLTMDSASTLNYSVNDVRPNGYGGTDQFMTLGPTGGNQTIMMTASYDQGSLTVTFDNVNVIDNTGSVKVKIGSALTETFSYSTLAQAGHVLYTNK